MSNMNISRRNFLGGIAAATAFAAAIVHAADPGFVDLFDGRTLNGWKPNGGSAEYSVEDGTIAGVGVPGTPGNTFLCTEREYENFIFKAEFKCHSGNSGIQFRSSTKPAPNFKNGTSVFGYQCEITPFGSNSGRIYDEGRRGFRNGIIWLDNTPKERDQEMLKTFRKDDWNSVEIQCVGPSIKTFINGVKVSDILDDCQQRGFFGLQIHAQKKTDKDGTPTEPGRAWWRNIQIKELPPCPVWKKFFVKGADGKMKVDGAKYVIPQDWSFVEDKDGAYLRGVHDKTEKKDGLVISLADYDNFMARVTYKLNGGNSALYFRAAEEDVPWVLKGFQNEIAGNDKDSALWHTRGKETKGRGWVASNDELVAKVRDAKGGWNTVSTIAVGDRIVNRINGFETFDIVDPLCEKTGKLGLQLHGGADNEMRFKDWEVMPVEPWMLPYILPEQKANAAEQLDADAKAAEIVQRMKAIRLPGMSFAPPKTIIDAVDFFCKASKKYDSAEIPEEKRGFNFALRMNPEVSAPTMVMIKATDISFYDALKLACECVDYTFEVNDSIVVVMPKQLKKDMEKVKNQR